MEPTHTEEGITKADAAEATPPPPEPWYTPLTKVTPLSKTLAAILFIILPVIGFWKGYQYGVVQKVYEVSPVEIEGEYEKEIESLPKDTEPKEEVWTKYFSEELGISFEYPEKLSLTEEGGVITLHHSIPYENTGDCDMIGDPDVTYPELTDFGMSFELVSPKIEPAYIDGEFSAGAFDGVYAYMGVEGCGQTYYFFDIAPDTTLLIKRENIQALFTGVNTWDREAILAVPEVVTGEKNRRFFEEILSSLELPEPRLSDFNPWTYTNNEYGFSIQLPDFVKPEHVQIGENGNLVVTTADYDYPVFSISSLSDAVSFKDEYYLERHDQDSNPSFSIRFKEYPDSYSPHMYLGENNKYVFTISGGQDCGGDGCVLWGLVDEIAQTFSVPSDSGHKLMGTVFEPSENVEILNTFYGDSDVEIFFYPEAWGTIGDEREFEIRWWDERSFTLTQKSTGEIYEFRARSN